MVRCERSENEDSLEVVKRSANMGRSEFYWPEGLPIMSHEKQPGGGGDLDAASIVLDLQKFHPAILDCNAYRGRARVQAVLYELL